MYIVDDIEQQIQRSEADTLFFVSDFAKTANDVFISRVLSEFTEKGLLCRLAKGIYYKPVKTRFGILYPEVGELVKAIARRDNAQVLPTGGDCPEYVGAFHAGSDELCLSDLWFGTQNRGWTTDGDIQTMCPEKFCPAE